MNIKSYGVPYMGSKAGIVHLIRYILERHYEKKYFIDVFTGGFAVSHYVLDKSSMDIIANDLNPYMMALYAELFYNDAKQFSKQRLDFVKRDTFMDVLKNPHNYPEWYVGYVLTLWSFGNKQTTFIYGMDIMDNKEALHEALVNNDWTLLNGITDSKFDIPQDIKDLDYRTHKYKRILFLQHYIEYIGEREQIDNLNRVERVDILTHSLRGKTNRIQLYNADWRAFIDQLPPEILNNAIIYCDPPYQDTAEYLAGQGFDHDAFWEWFRECPYPVYVSSYKAPDDIPPLNFELKRQTLAGGSGKLVTENLYYNGKGEPEPTLEDLLFNCD